MAVLLTESSHGALKLTLNRPECRNALSRELIREATAALRSAEADAAIRSVIITGAPPAFCAGLDLREVANATLEQAERDSIELMTLFETIDGLSKPVIAAVNGPAVAGGAGLVSVCDIVLCAEAACIGYPEIKRGLIAAIVMSYLRRLVGERQAKYLLLTGESVSARQAVEIGLATESVPDDQLDRRAWHYAAMFAAYAAGPLSTTKAFWARTRDLPHAEAVQEGRRLNASMRLARESQAGVDTFLHRKT
jgi:methylglutaconyl-CoA hydratase